MAIGYRLIFLAVLICSQESFQQGTTKRGTNPHTSRTSEPAESESNPHDTDISAEAPPLAPFEWMPQAGLVSESRRRRPDKGWGALAPALLAASTVLPLLLTGLAALAGKALMSSILALAVAGFNLFRSTQPPPNNGF